MRRFPKVLLSSLLLVSLATSACRPSTNGYEQTTNAAPLAEVQEQSSPQQPAKNSSYWVNVGSTTNGSAIDVDTKSIQINGAAAIYFTRMRHSSPLNGVLITAVHEVMDCRSGLYQSLEYMGFSNQGRMIASSQESSPISQAKPGTLQAGVYSLVCGQAQIAFDPNLEQARATQSFDQANAQQMESFRSSLRTTEEYLKNRQIGMQRTLEEGMSQRFDSPPQALYPCDYTSQTDSLGRACGGRAAIVRPGGRF